MAKRATKTKDLITVDEACKILNRVLDVESEKIAKKENRTYEAVRSESICEVKDDYVVIYTSDTMAARIEKIFKLVKEDRLNELDD